MSAAPSDLLASGASSGGRRAGGLRLRWRRDLLMELVRRDLRERYAGSALGGLWTFIHPLVLVGLYILVFSTILQARFAGTETRYAVFLCAGLLPWHLFQETVARGAQCFTAYANLIKKTAFPKTVLPVAVALSSFAGFGIAFTLFVIYCLALTLFTAEPVPVSAYQMAGVLLVLGLQTVFALGLALGLASLNVFFRDIAQMTTIGLQILFWLTPVVWSPAAFVETHAGLVQALQWNPMYPFVDAYHRVFASNPAYGPGPLYGRMLFWTAAAVVFGLVAYWRLRDEVAENL